MSIHLQHIHILGEEYEGGWLNNLQQVFLIFFYP